MAQTSNGSARANIEPKTVTGVLTDLAKNLGNGSAKEFLPIATGFQPLDQVLGGGLHAGELTLVAGAPGVGKTIATLQWARAVAKDGGAAIYACYEHDEAALLIRLLGLELGELSGSRTAEDMDHLREGLGWVAKGEATLADILSGRETLRTAYEELQRYADRLWLVRCSGTRTGIEALEEMVRRRRADTTVLFVDYLQKVAIDPSATAEGDKSTRIAEGLKDLALGHRVPVVAVVAGSAEGISSRRLRMHNLSGSAALAYEADIAIMVNDKFSCVSKAHLAYDSVRAKTFKDFSVFSIEKNRGGPTEIDLEFRKDFPHFRFDPLGGTVAERLVDERIYSE